MGELVGIAAARLLDGHRRHYGVLVLEMAIDRLDRYARCCRDTIHRSLSVAILQERLPRSVDNCAPLALHQGSFRIIGGPGFHKYLSAFLLSKKLTPS